MQRNLHVFLLLTLILGPLHGQIVISEIDAINCGSTADLDGNDRDWIELHNTGTSPVALTGWALSDDLNDPGKWIFPDVSLAGGAQLIVFASGKNWQIPGVELHTNFRLSAGGGDVLLSQPNETGGWTIVHALTAYPEQRPGFSFGYADSSPDGALGYFENPSPGNSNATSTVQAFVSDTDFDHIRGFYSAPFDLGIVSATPGATIAYTLDGTLPGPGNGVQVPSSSAMDTPTAVIPITTTTIVRACAFKDGMGSTNVDTHSYIFAADVLRQDQTSVPGPFAPWGHSGPDWEMDPRVTENENPEDRCVPEDLLKIPTVSVVMNWSELFGADGIYVKGEGVDLPASLEILNPGGRDTHPNASIPEHGRGTVRIFGGSSTAKRWKTDKLSFRFNFFQDLDSVVLGEEAIGTYDRLVLDARLNNVWTQSQNFEQRQFGDYVRDAILTDLEQEIGVKSVHSQHVHLYLNGLYWGLYTLHERPDKHFTAAYFGGDKDDWDVVKHDPGADNFLVDGARIDPTRDISNSNYTAGVNYLNMVQLSREDLRFQENYDALAAVLDIPALINHILVNFYGGNYDWPQHNWYASRNRADPEGKWRYHSWDAEHVFKYVDYPRYDNVTNKFEGWDRPDGINLSLLQNPEYRFLFADTVHRYMFNNGPFSVDCVWSIFEKRFNDIDEAIRAESARWGDSGQQGDSSRKELHLRYSDIPTSSSPDPRQSDTTDYASWYHERMRIQTKLLGPEPNRATRFLDQLRKAVYHEDHPQAGQPNPMYPSTDAPVFNQHGGRVPDGFSVTMTNPNNGGAGTLYFTTDGSDPRAPYTGGAAFFSGDINSTAKAYTTPVPIVSTTTLKSRILKDGEWSALNEAVFVPGPVDVVQASSENLVISEIHYHPVDPSIGEQAKGFLDANMFEFFEVRNVGSDVITLEGIQMDQGLDIVVYNLGTELLAPGASAVFAANPEAFTYRYGTGKPIAGEFTAGTSLSNGGERLNLLAADGTTLVDLSYDDESPWPVQADGSGPSMVLIQPGYRDSALGWNWRPSTGVGGSPGADDDFESFATWSRIHFSPDEVGYPEIALPGADPDMDGLSNLEERFFGTDPREPAPLGASIGISLETLNIGFGPAVYAIYTLRYVKGSEDILFTPRTYTDLDPENPQQMFLIRNPVDNGDGTETRVYRSPAKLEDEHNRWFALYLELR